MKRARTWSLLLSLSFLLAASVTHAQQNANWKRMDRNNDGKVTKDEFPERFRDRFDQMDADGDGSVSSEEFVAARRRQNRNAQQQQQQQRRRQQRAPEPTHADVQYGEHPKQAFDIWLAESQDGEPTPLVIYIHGGGFRGGDKNSAAGHPIADYLDKGISFASMNYRLSDVGPYPIMMHDAARGLQYIRSKAEEWNIDPERIACYGGSAGAGISLWLGFHDDLADPDSDDPVARQSTRIVAAGTTGGQSTYDMRTFREWFGVPDLPPHPALVTFYGVQDDEDWQSERVIQLMEDASPINHLTKDDVPVFMVYGRGDVPVDENSSPGLWVHHARLGLKLKEAMDKLGLECHVTWRDNPSEKYDGLHAFLQDKVTGGKAADTEQRRGADRRQSNRGNRRGRTNARGEFYAPPAMQERVDSRLQVGDEAPPFTLPQADGSRMISLSDYEGEQPVVLVFGSITCSPFRQKVTQTFDLHKKYGGQAQFLMIYIREAHPESTILMPTADGESVLKKFTQTDSVEERTANAQSCTSLLDVPFPVLVDAEDNAALAAYGGWPIRLVVVDKQGRIAWDSGEGPRGFQPDKLAQWLESNLSP